MWPFTKAKTRYERRDWEDAALMQARRAYTNKEAQDSYILRCIDLCRRQRVSHVDAVARIEALEAQAHEHKTRSEKNA